MRKLIMAFATLLLVFGIFACNGATTLEEIESISLNFVPQNTYERGTPVTLNDKTISVKYVGVATPVSLSITAQGVAVSGDGYVSGNLKTDVVGKYTVSIVYEENMIELSYYVDDSVLLAVLNNPSNYATGTYGPKFKNVFGTESNKELFKGLKDTGDLAKLGLLFYWDKVGTTATVAGYSTAPDKVMYGGVESNNETTIGTGTVYNDIAAYVKHKAGDTFDGTTYAPSGAIWDSCYEFQQAVKDSVAYRYQNKAGNAAIGEKMIGGAAAYDVDKLLGDVYKTVMEVKTIQTFDDVPVDTFIDEMEILLYGGNLTMTLATGTITKTNFKGIEQFSAAELTSFYSKLDHFFNEHSAAGITPTTARLSFKLEKIDGSNKVNGIYGDLWKAALEVNGFTREQTDAWFIPMVPKA
ncbi:MAG: hypothetical protein PHW40_06840 [Candidatus Izemoplasmatales bacterium]|nr:hypothetical protein [Candidatus Izemoplasmatales bacterium]